MPSADSPTPAPRPLRDLLRGVSGPVRGDAGGVEVTGITADTRALRPGMLYVAQRGTKVDGHDFAAEAARRGAGALVVEREVETDGARVPVLRVDDTDRALAELAAAWEGHPAAGMTLVGITGTAGKTSTLALLEAVLAEADLDAGTIGSLGVHADGETLDETGYTAPDAVLLQHELRRLADAGSTLVAMEVTSHALVQQRVAGLAYDLGIFTNLLPLEHAEYHGTFRAYAEAKARFFDHLRPCAPLVYNAGDRAVRRLVHGRDVSPVGCGESRTAMVRVEPLSVTAGGTRLVLNVRRPLPRVGGGEVDAQRIELHLRVLGRTNLANAALAATAALCLGAPAEAVRAALPRVDAPPRRIQVVHEGAFTVIDDTTGHPESVSALMEVVEKLAPRRVHAAVCIRGARGPRINRELAESLRAWSGRRPLHTLVVTGSDDAADARNRVTDDERDAFLRPLRDHGVPHDTEPRMEDAVARVLDAAGEGDLVLLMGAQGMDAAADVVRRRLGG